MADLSLQDALWRRWSELEANRKTTEDTWNQINDNLLGRARDFTFDQRSPGEQRVQRLYDDTAKVSGSLLAGALHSLLMNPSGRWFSLRFEDERVNDVHAASEWIHESENAVFAALARPQANFHAQAAEAWLDLVFFGTGAMFTSDSLGDGVRFSARPLTELFLSEDSSGIIDLVIRKFYATPRQAAQIFGVENLPEKARREMESGKQEDKTPYLHFVLPNEEMTPGNLDVTGMPWSSFYMALEGREIVSSGGFHEMPYAVARWQKESAEIYGRGPGWNALSDQKSLNEMKRVMLIAGQKHVDPPLLVDHEGVLGGGSQLDTTPGGVIPVNVATALMNPAVQPLQFGGNFAISRDLVGDTRAQVQDAFHHQLIQVIRDPNMTATQVLELSAQMQRHLAPILGRMTTELLEPIIERVFAIEARAGRLPVPPPELEGMPLRIEYVSPVARAQRTSQAQGVTQWMTVLANLSQVDPAVLDVPDTDAIARDLAESFGVPPTLMRAPEEIAARRQAAAERQKQQEEAQLLMQGTEAARNLGQAAQSASTAESQGAGTVQ
jgi:hypothetical protein